MKNLLILLAVTLPAVAFADSGKELKRMIRRVQQEQRTLHREILRHYPEEQSPAVEDKVPSNSIVEVIQVETPREKLLFDREVRPARDFGRDKTKRVAEELRLLEREQ
ncbi:MAG: hypothetical protein N2578_09945 [Bdellovibrionaceae bacterium]|nr:hypothetical protein [Pseudobdellovibrionaceae bacterium]